jgi:Dolichyl-phosphate-mannose-protein mannosyltransferase
MPTAESAIVTDTSTPTDPPARRLTDWHRAVVVGLIAYVVTRLCVLAGAAVRASQMAVDARKLAELAGVPADEPTAVHTITEVLTSWDGRWYLELIRRGYPESIPADITYEQLEARAAFFPVYPWIARAVDWVLPGGDTLAAIFVNIVLGAVAVVLVGMLARELYGVTVASRAMVLFVVFPGSFVLSFTYSEATLIVLAAACLLFLLREQWWLAGIAAMFGTATRPNGVGLVAACIVASFLAIRRSRDWVSLVAVVLSPLGFIGFQLYVDHTTGERGAWFRVQSEAWKEGTSFGATAVTNTLDFVTNPFSSPTDALTALSMAALIAMIYCAWRVRLALPLAAYSAVVVALMLIPETVTARPRFLITAFPLLIAAAAWWARHDEAVAARADADGTVGDRLTWSHTGWDMAMVAGGAGIAVLTGIYAVFGAIP